MTTLFLLNNLRRGRGPLLASLVRGTAVAALLPMLALPVQELAAETLAPAPAQPLTITILEGEGALNNIRVRDAREPIVQVTDANHKPVASATVIFLMHGSASGAGGSFLPAATGTVSSAAAAQSAAGVSAASGGAAGSAGAVGAGGASGGAVGAGQVTVSTDTSVFQGVSSGADQAFTTTTDSEGKAHARLRPNDLTGAFLIAIFVISPDGRAAAYIHEENVRGAAIAKGGKLHTLTHGAPLAAVITVTAVVLTAVLVTTNTGGSGSSGGSTTITTGPGGVTTPGVKPAGGGVSFSFGRK